MEFLGGGSEPEPHQLGVLGERCKLLRRGPGRSPGKFGFWSILGPQKSRENGQLAFESGERATSESGGHVSPCPNVELPLLLTTARVMQ